MKNAQMYGLTPSKEGGEGGKGRRSFRISVAEALLLSLPPAKGKAPLNVAALKPKVDALCGADVPKASIATALVNLFKEQKVSRAEKGKYTLGK
jgi:hypothetical protein